MKFQRLSRITLTYFNLFFYSQTTIYFRQPCRQRRTARLVSTATPRPRAAPPPATTTTKPTSTTTDPTTRSAHPRRSASSPSSVRVTAPSSRPRPSPPPPRRRHMATLSHTTNHTVHRTTAATPVTTGEPGTASRATQPRDCPRSRRPAVRATPSSPSSPPWPTTTGVEASPAEAAIVNGWKWRKPHQSKDNMMLRINILAVTNRDLLAVAEMLVRLRRWSTRSQQRRSPAARRGPARRR